MTPTLLLHIAAIVSLLFAAGHTRGGLRKWSPMGENDVLAAMRDRRFDVMGTRRSYLDFFMGFGWSISVTLTLQSILLWQLATLAQTHGVHVRPMIAVFGAATAATAWIAWRYILPLPALLSLVQLVLLVAAYVSAS